MKLRLPSASLPMLLGLCSVACPSEPSDAQAAQRDAAPPPALDASTPAPQKPQLISSGRNLMGTWFELKIEQHERDAEARAAIERGLAEIARLENVLSEWRPETDVSQLNEQAGGPAVQIGHDTLAVLSAGVAISKLSGGAFDMTWAAMRGLYRFDRDAPRQLPEPKLVRQKRALVNYQDLLLDASARTARLRRKGMAVGTGGIAKGYALDRVSQIFEEAGFTNYLLFAGGQVQVHGAREGRAWRVGIQHPRRPRHVGFFEVHDGSISTSGDYEHSYEVNGKRIHHIIDTRTGLPASKSASVTLVARHGIAADALSTACFVMGPQPCVAMLQKLGDGTEAVIIDPEMRVTMTPGLVGKVAFNPPLVDGRLPD